MRSNFETRFLNALKERGVTKVKYEPVKISYIKKHSYTPDFVLPNGIIIECKGYFKPSDRAKHLLIKAQHPELDIRFVFQRDNKLSKQSKTSYSDWCKKHGFEYHIGVDIPDTWLKGG